MERVAVQDGLAEGLGKHGDLRVVLLWTKRPEVWQTKTCLAGYKFFDKLGRHDIHTLHEGLEQLGRHYSQELCKEPPSKFSSTTRY